MSEHRGGRVVVGVSQSPAGLQALRYAVAEARRRRVPLHAVRAWRFAVSWHGSDVQQWRSEIADEALRHVHDAFDAAMGGMPTDIEVIVAAPEGRSDTVLTDIAGDCRDLLVLGGSSGRRWSSWLVRGCVRRAACLVTVVPPPDLARIGDFGALTRRLLREAETVHDHQQARSRCAVSAHPLGSARPKTRDTQH
jgi:nucleotide-binding universal stress UspA family protein